MDMRICLDETGLVFSWAGTLSSQTALGKIVRLAALCRGEEAEISQFEEVEEQHCMELKKEKTEYQMKKDVEMKVKERWHRPTGV